jgi:hypothetical protein
MLDYCRASLRDAVREAFDTNALQLSLRPISAAENWTQNRNRNVSPSLAYRSVF